MKSKLKLVESEISVDNPLLDPESLLPPNNKRAQRAVATGLVATMVEEVNGPLFQETLRVMWQGETYLVMVQRLQGPRA